MKKKVVIDQKLMAVQYNGRIIPNGRNHDIFKTGANCQVFAYHLLRFYDFIVPDYRSSELWEDTKLSELVVTDYQPLDILFFHKNKKPYGAHLAAYLGNNQAIHLSKKVGIPVIWTIDSFFQHPRYKFLLGGKRFFKEE